ncbi:MAG: lysozyme inhibitor LprI family protein [Ramlibacter sp.]
MAEAWKQGALGVAALVAGGALAFWAWNAWQGQAPVAPVTPVAGGAPADVVVEPAAPPSLAPAPADPAVVAAATAACPAEPLLERTGPRDGQFSLQAAQSVNPGSDPSAFLTVAGEMAADGRPRDAEVAFIMACRVAAQTAGAPSAPLADVKTELAQHYAAMAARESAREQRPQLLQRVEGLLADSVRAYTGALGANASKTRLATQRLAALRQPVETILSGNGEPASDPATLGAAPASAEAAANPEAAAECANARSPSEKLICSDAELAEMDQDLDRLRAQARAVTRDPGGFAQRQEQAWAKREAQCRGDKACLRAWYAQRKRELFREFSVNGG